MLRLTLVVLTLLIALTVACASSTDSPSDPTEQGLLGFLEPLGLIAGPASLEEQIMRADVIARASLRSVSPGVDSQTTPEGAKYFSTLEHTFDVTTYLKGSGTGDRVVAVVSELRDRVPYKALPRELQTFLRCGTPDGTAEKLSSF